MKKIFFLILVIFISCNRKMEFIQSETIPSLILVIEPTLKSKACLKCLYFTIIIFDLCRYLEYFSYLCTINQTE